MNAAIQVGMLLLIGAPIAVAQFTDDEDRLLRAVLTQNDYINHFLEMPNKNTRLAVRDYNILYQQYGRRHPEILHLFWRQFGRVPGIQDYLEETIRSHPHDYLNSDTRTYYAKILGSIRRPWAARLLAIYLFEERPLGLSGYSPEEIERYIVQHGYSISSHSAVVELSGYDLPGAPVLTYPLADKVPEWREWWRVNQGDLEEIMAGFEVPSETETSDENIEPTDRRINLPSAEPATPLTELVAEASEERSPKYWILAGLGAVGALLFLIIKFWCARNSRKES